MIFRSRLKSILGVAAPSTLALSTNRYLLLRFPAAASIAPRRPPDHDPLLSHRRRAALDVSRARTVSVGGGFHGHRGALLSTTALVPPTPGLHVRRRARWGMAAAVMVRAVCAE